MKTYYDDGALALEFEGAEKELLVLSLAGAKEGYEADYDTLPERIKKFWDGTLSTGAARELGDAAADLRDERLSWRPDRLKAIEQWLEPDGALTGPEDAFVLEGAEIETFFCVLNDRRLTLAAGYDVDEAKMETNPADVEEKELQRALWEIHFLAFVMENCLQAMRADDEG